MKIRKGDKLRIICSRKGTYDAVATANFDTHADEWYDVAVDQDEPVIGMSMAWYRDDEIPARRGQCKVRRRSTSESKPRKIKGRKS